MSYKYDLINDFGEGKTSDGIVSSSPGWLVGVVPLGRPVTYDRAKSESFVDVIAGIVPRVSPYTLKSECIGLSISNSKGSYAKNMSARFKDSERNLLSVNGILPGDWIFAWCHSYIQDTDKTEELFLTNKKINNKDSGLKFLGRAHSVRKHVDRSPTGALTSTYSLQAVGFNELDSVHFYNPLLATVDVMKDALKYLSQIGLDTFDWSHAVGQQGGNLRDNSEDLIEAFIKIILGEGVGKTANDALDRGRDSLKGGVVNGEFSPDAPGRQSTPQSKEAPYAFLTPSYIKNLMGLNPIDPIKGTKHNHPAIGYSDLLTVLGGKQTYSDPSTYMPDLKKEKSKGTRLSCQDRIKGTYIPISPEIINVPLWNIMEKMYNPLINEMYTAMRQNVDGDIMPTLVLRQIPFSSDAITEDLSIFPLTRFTSLPRWVASPNLVSNFDVGRSDATRFNFIQVSGQLDAFPKEIANSLYAQIAKNAPIADVSSIARTGFKPIMATLQVVPADILRRDSIGSWVKAIADWSIDSQYSLNGTMVCVGLQSPICEGDNLEFEGVIYHIESVTHNCGIDMNGTKKFFTSLTLTHGMAVDQGVNPQIPIFPGFAKGTNLSKLPTERLSNLIEEEDGLTKAGFLESLESFEKTRFSETQSDNLALTSTDPGSSQER